MNKYFDEMIDRKGTYCTQWDYTEDRFGKKGILPFSISDMDFQSPKEILNAINKRALHGVFGYTRWNHEDFKKSILSWYERRFFACMKEEWIVYSPSVIYSIATLIELLTEENDAIVMHTPAYDAFFNQIEAAKRQLLKNELMYENGQYIINFDDLEEKLSKVNVKIFLLCNPHNPTGRVWTKAELKQILHLCDKYDVKIISDDIHMDIVYGEKMYTPITEISADVNNVYICTSASKTFNTPSLGGSYSFIPNETVREQFLQILKARDGLSSAHVFGVLAVIEGYNEAEYWVDELRSYLYNNMKTVKAFIDEQLPNLQFTIPESTYLAWIDCSNLNRTSAEIQQALVEVGGVGIMSGDVYGATQGQFLRMNIGCPKSKVEEGLKRLKQAIESLQ